tara:strand:- start:1557 stop:2174 length:618 start_codon:yes stop_codon:yes gene_type:complete
MTTISDMIKQLEEKASKYDELISDIGELLSKYTVEVNNETTQQIPHKRMKKVDVFEDLIKGQTVDIKSKRGDLYDERLFKLISYYEIPLKLSKKIAQFSNWESIAQGWCGAEAKGKLTKWVVDNSEAEPVVYDTGYYYYEFTCAKSSETRGRRRTVKTRGPCGKLNIHKTRRQITDKSKHQGYCKNCGNRVRLNPDNVRLLEGVD